MNDCTDALSDTFLDQPLPLTIISGHYGVGKTNLALNLIRRWVGKSAAASTTASATRFTLIDLDVVNPYFRSSDSADWLIRHSVTLLGPSLARSTLDTPALAPGIDEALRRASSEHPVVVDVGGDPDGARALARYNASVAARDYQLIFVANFNRPEVATAEAALAMLRAIEEQSGLKVTALIGNTHLKQLTTVEQVMSTMPELLKLSEMAGVPIIAVTAPEDLADDLQRAIGEAGGGGGGGSHNSSDCHRSGGGSNRNSGGGSHYSGDTNAGANTPPVVWSLVQMVTTPWEAESQ